MIHASISSFSRVASSAGWLLFGQGRGEPPSFFSLEGPLVPMVAIGVLFYFMIWRSERRRRATAAAMIENLKKNDRVVTIGGIFGTVVNVTKGTDEVTLRVDDSNNTRLRFQRSAIARVIDETAGAKDKESGS